MKYFAAIMLVFLPLINRTGNNKTRVQGDDSYCDLKGAVYVETGSRYANFRVYEDSTEAFADMLVYKADNALFADRPGIWYFVNNRGMADFSIGLVGTKGEADFSICYTSLESMAGCSQK